MNDKDIRWRQRFEYFSRDFLFLTKSLEIAKPSELERTGIIQSFNIAFELGWKTIRVR